MTERENEGPAAADGSKTTGATQGPPPFDGPSVAPKKAAAPPHPLDTTWKITVDNEVYGPYSGREMKAFIKEGRVLSSTAIQKDGATQWQAAASYPMFESDFKTEASRAAPMGSNGGATAAVYAPEPWQPPKSLGIAVLLSFLLPGLGQLYNGQIGKFLAFLLCSVLVPVAASFLLPVVLFNFGILPGSLVLPLLFAFFILWVWSMVDAYKVANSINDYHHLRYKKSLKTRK